MPTNNFVTDYDPHEVIVSFGGVTIEGFETGTFVTIVKPVDTWGTKSGIGGEGMYVKNNDPWYDISFTLMANAASNDYLSAVMAGDMNLTGTGLLPLQIKNNLGREMFITASARIIKLADLNFSDAGEPKTWNLKAYKSIFYVGGH